MEARAHTSPQLARNWLNLADLLAQAEELNMDAEQTAAKLVSALHIAASRGE